MVPPFLSPVTIGGRSDGATAIIELRGELDLAAERQLAAELGRRLAHKPAVMVIDLRELSFIDAWGIGVLIQLRARCQQIGTRLRLIADRRIPRRLLAMFDLEHTFAFVDSVRDALVAARGTVSRPSYGG
jgi:anti-anti-sigma factor